MSVACGVNCVMCLGCPRWVWKRLTYSGSDESESWPPASPDDFEPIPRLCRAILAIYEPDLHNPRYAPSPDGYPMKPEWLVKRVTYEQNEGRCPPYIIYADHDHKEIVVAIRGLNPPYIIYADHDHKEIVVAIRGLNLVRESDYKVLMDNRLGMQMFDGGFVHRGLLRAATWVLSREAETIKELLKENADYRLVLCGHSLGSGVAALMAVIVVNHRNEFGGIPRDRIRCYAIAPARSMSLNLAVKYADVIHSVVLQDDFLPRMATPLEHIFGSIFCLPCLLFLVYLRDTCIPESVKLHDPRRLYAPGRLYHIVERKFCRCGRFPPEVRTTIPVEGRFEHVVLSCNVTSDHHIINIEREARKAFNRMKEHSEPTAPPAQQRMERKQTLEKEHIDALERAVTLHVPHAVPPPEESTIAVASFESPNETANVHADTSPVGAEATSRSHSKSSGRTTNWQELVEKLFNKNESGNLVLKKEFVVPK